MRLIDADALIADIERTIEESGCVNHEGEIMDCVRYAPEANVASVVRGEWVEKTYIHEYANEETEERQYVVCSICGKQPPSGFGAVNFCHNCGADMRRESEGST